MKTALRTKRTCKALEKCKTSAVDKSTLPLDDGQRERFCQAILFEKSAAAAAVKAGYSPASARVTATRLLKDKEVQGRIAFLFSSVADRKILRKRDILLAASTRARATFADVSDLIGLSRAAFDTRLKVHPFASAIKEVKYAIGPDGELRVTDIKLHSPVESEQEIIDMLGWNEPDKVQVSGTVGIVYLPEQKRVTDA